MSNKSVGSFTGNVQDGSREGQSNASWEIVIPPIQPQKRSQYNFWFLLLLFLVLLPVGIVIIEGLTPLSVNQIPTQISPIHLVIASGMALGISVLTGLFKYWQVGVGLTVVLSFTAIGVIGLRLISGSATPPTATAYTQNTAWEVVNQAYATATAVHQSSIYNSQNTALAVVSQAYGTGTAVSQNSIYEAQGRVAVAYMTATAIGQNSIYEAQNIVATAYVMATAANEDVLGGRTVDEIQQEAVMEFRQTQQAQANSSDESRCYIVYKEDGVQGAYSAPNMSGANGVEVYMTQEVPYEVLARTSGEINRNVWWIIDAGPYHGYAFVDSKRVIEINMVACLALTVRLE